MKRFTFSVMMALATMVSNAQNFGTKAWSDNLSTMEVPANFLRSTPVTVDNEGNAIVTGRYDMDFTFSNDVARGTDADNFIAKYDKSGKKLWAVAVQAENTITAITTDSEGNVYVAGNFAQTVNVTDVKGKTETITGMADKTSGACFIAKYNKNGELQMVKTVLPEADQSVITDDILWAQQEPSFHVNKIVAANGKLYLSATYKEICKIGDLTLSGKFVNSEVWMLADAPSASVISLDAEALDNAKELVTLSAKEKMTAESIYGPEDINFTVDGTVIYVGLVAKGKEMTLKTVKGEENISLAYEAGAQEHAFVLAKINGNDVTTKVYNTQAAEASFSWNYMDEMVCKNGKLYVAGTFNEANPFDNTVTFNKNCDIYVAALNANDLSKSWVAASGFDEGETNKTAEVVTGMAVNGDNVIVTGWAETTDGHVVSTPLTFTVDANGHITQGEETLVTAMATNGTNVLTESDKDGAYIYTYYTNTSETGIKQLVKAEGISRQGDVLSFAKAADINVYAVNGTCVKAEKNATSISLEGLAKGVYVVKAGDKSVKVAK